MTMSLELVHNICGPWSQNAKKKSAKIRWSGGGLTTFWIETFSDSKTSIRQSNVFLSVSLCVYRTDLCKIDSGLPLLKIPLNVGYLDP